MNGAATIDLGPLIPVVNMIIQSVAGLLVLAVPVLVTYATMWLRSHNINLKESTQAIIQQRLTTTVQNSVKFAEGAADTKLPELKINIADPKLAAAVQYIIAQSPDLLKKAGVDPTTEEGQQIIARRVVAEAAPVPVPVPVPVVEPKQ